MPPHCDTRDGPVVKAAIKALETRNINYALIWIPEKSERDLKEILKTVEDDLTDRFHRVMKKKTFDADDVAAGREFIEAFIGWVVYSHHLYMSIKGAGGHGEQQGGNAGCGHHA